MIGRGCADTDRYVVVGLARGITTGDEAYFRQHPREVDCMRCVFGEELETEPAATHVLIYQDRDFDGKPTGHRHRMLLKRVPRAWEPERGDS